MTLLQAARSPGTADKFIFLVDETVINVTVYITGRSVTFTLISPTGINCRTLYVPLKMLGVLKTVRLC